VHEDLSFHSDLDCRLETFSRLDSRVGEGKFYSNSTEEKTLKLDRVDRKLQTSHFNMLQGDENFRLK
jgi:hypothetical protein